tara:strand:- start:294 stop:572 length:279 start_codon:yes stop_codon:yes gene_type:complete
MAYSSSFSAYTGGGVHLEGYAYRHSASPVSTTSDISSVGITRVPRSRDEPLSVAANNNVITLAILRIGVESPFLMSMSARMIAHLSYSQNGR